jgi:hypothetical protein
VYKYPNTGENWLGQKFINLILQFYQYQCPHIWTHAIRLGHIRIVKSSGLIKSKYQKRGAEWLCHRCANLTLRFDQYHCPVTEYNWCAVWTQVCCCNVLESYCTKLTNWHADYFKAIVSRFSVYGLHFSSNTKMATVLTSGLRTAVMAHSTELSYCKMLDFWKRIHNKMMISRRISYYFVSDYIVMQHNAFLFSVLCV